MHFDENCKFSEVSTTGRAFEVNLAVSIVSWDLQGPARGVVKLGSEPGQVRALNCACK